MKKGIFSVFAALILTFSLSTAVFAHDVPDLTKDCAISVTMQYEGKAVPGGTLTLYRVGNVQEENGNYYFELNNSFAPSGVILAQNLASSTSGTAQGDISSAETAKALADYANKNKLSGRTANIKDDGTVIFSKEAIAGLNLKPGLYLMVQNKGAEGFNKIEPFLVSVPQMNEDGIYEYKVDASPKVNLEKDTQTTPTPIPSKPTDSKLPQTGQLNWPVPVLVITGLLLFSFGWLLRFGKKQS